MQTLARFSQTRNVDLGLSVGMVKRGWALLHSKDSATESSNTIADLVFSSDQVSQFKQVFKDFPFPSKMIKSRFDILYDELEKAVNEKSHDKIVKLSTDFLEEYPIKLPTEQGDFISNTFQFYLHRSSKANEQELSYFFKTLQYDQQKQHFSDIMNRVDILKAQSLALAAIGEIWEHPADPISQIRSEIALTFHVAYENTKEKLKIKNLVGIKQVMAMASYLPAYIFEIEPCKWEIDSVKPLTESEISDKDKKGIIDDFFLSSDTNKNLECSCDCGDPECKATDACCGKINYYVTDVLELREKTIAYTPSSLAYIENIALGETRERVHQFSKNIEIYNEDQTTTTTLEERDHQVTDKSKLQKEIQKQMQASLDVEAKVTGTGYSVNSNASASRDVSEREAREKFKEIVTKAKESITTESRSLNTRRVSTGTSETNTHNQTAKEKAVVSKYFHVSEKKIGQVYSHGLHLMMDILIPSPALRFEELQRRKASSLFKFQEPLKPSVTLSNIDISKYSSYVEFYELTDAPSPPVVNYGSYSNNYQGNRNDRISITVPQGYEAYKLELIDGELFFKNLKSKCSLSCEFGGGVVTKWRGNNTSDITSTTISSVGTSDAMFPGYESEERSWIKVKISFRALPVDLGPWKEEMLALIFESYEAKKQAYEDALAENEMQFKEQEAGMHPFTAEEHIRTQMKQSAIHMMCEKFDDENVVNLMSQSCGYPEINRKKATEATKRWHFFDRAFDWNRAEIIFYDYFRNPICKWVDTFDPDESNFMLKSFRRAGYARIQIPTTPAMEFDVLTYLKTGKTWGGNGEPPSDPNDPRYTAVTFELKHSYDCYQNDRNGTITAITRIDPISNNIHPTNQVLLEDSNFYLDTFGNIDYQLIDLDKDHEIFIDGMVYRLLDIIANFTNSTPTSWTLTLDHVFESPYLIDVTDLNSDLIEYKHAIGAKFLGDKFFFELPTDLIWLGDGNDNCLPEYPIDC